MISFNMSGATRIGLNLLALLGVVIALYLGRDIFIPLVIAALLAGMVYPTVGWLNRVGFSWDFSCLLVVGGLVLLNLVVTVGFAMALPKMLHDMPDLRTGEGQKEMYRAVQQRVDKLWPQSKRESKGESKSATKEQRKDQEGKNDSKSKGEGVQGKDQGPGQQGENKGEGEPSKKNGASQQSGSREEAAPQSEEYFPEDPEKSKVFKYIQGALTNSTYITNALWNIGYYSNNWLWQWVLVMFLLLFMLLDGRMLSRRIVEIFGPSKEAQAKAVETLVEMAKAVRTFLVWRTLVNFALGVTVGAVYHWVFGLSQSWTWALLTAIACYVPYLGPMFAGIPPVLDAFVTAPSPYYALFVIVFYIVVLTLEGYVLVPVVMGRSMELNATTVMLACLFWQLVWGLPGLFLAMPLMAAIKAICAHVPGWRPWANLMSSSEAEIPLEKIKATEAFLQLDDTQLISAADADSIAAEKQSFAKKK